MKCTLQERIQKLKNRIFEDTNSLKRLEALMVKNNKNYLPVYETKSIDTVKEKCRKCGGSLILRQHKHITQKHLNQPYYFSKWLFCRNCNAVFFNENDKVFKNGWRPVNSFFNLKRNNYPTPPANWREIALEKERKMREASQELENNYQND